MDVRRAARRGQRWRVAGLVVVAAAALVVAANLALAYVFPPARPAPAFPGAPTPLFIAHQGGELLAPSNTMAAFRTASELGADVLETDIHMTKDGELVTIHDETVDRTTDGSGRVDAFTYAELSRLDAGHRFTDLSGRASYRGKGVRIPRLEELFATYGGRHLFNVEIKAPYPGIEARLWALIQRYGLRERIVVVAFDQATVDRFRAVSGGRVALGAGEAEARTFVLAHKARLPGFYRPQASALQLPTASSGLNLKDEALIEGAHRLGQQVHYWTINDEPTMHELVDLGADVIMTDRPDLLRKVLGR